MQKAIVVALTHRAAPRFQYPAAVEDVQRAVRFVRANAATYEIDPNRIGAAGSSSGGHLVSMVGTLDGNGDPDDAGGVPEALFVGARIHANTAPASAEFKRYAVASPITHVTRDDPPFLLFHGDEDTAVPFQQSVAMEAALRNAGVEVQLVRVAGGRHGRNFGFAADDASLPDYLSYIARCFDDHLRSRS